MITVKLSALILVILAPLAAAWETEEQAAHQVRHLLSSASEHFFSGVLSTLYPPSHTDTSLHHSPLSGPEYFAPCQSNGDLTFLALPVSQNWRNALAPGANVTFSVGSHPDPAVVDWRHASEEDPRSWQPHRPRWRRGMPSKLRVTLFGHVVPLPAHPHEATRKQAECFTEVHPDSLQWAPGSSRSPHEARWVHFVVDRIYAVGGFGDEHRIGWITKEAYAHAGSDSLRQQQQQHDEEEEEEREEQSEEEAASLGGKLTLLDGTERSLSPSEVLFGENHNSKHPSAQTKGSRLQASYRYDDKALVQQVFG